MTGRPCRLDPEQHCVSVTVDPGLDDVHPVPGGSALLPEPARARVEPRAPGYHVYSRVALPRLGLPQLASIMKAGGYDNMPTPTRASIIKSGNSRCA